MTQWEYAVFAISVPRNPTGQWPNIAGQEALLAEMNRLGSEGWEVFARACPAFWEPTTPGQMFPYNLWARRPVGASPTPEPGNQPGTGSNEKEGVGLWERQS